MIKDILGKSGLMVSLVKRASQVHKVSLDMLVCEVRQVKKVPLVILARMETKDIKFVICLDIV